MQKNKNKQQGFSLIELAVVLVIVGIMLFASISIGAIQIEAAKLKQTRDKINKIDRALQLYLEANNALPCPAGGALARSHADYGRSLGNNPSSAYSNATCASVQEVPGGNPLAYTGVIPNRSLDLPDDFMVDGWGNRFTYSVSKHCVDADNWSGSDRSIERCTNGTLTAGNNYDTGGTLTIRSNSNVIRTEKAVYVVVSHGRNGFGAFSKEGPRNTVAELQSAYELDNSNRAGFASGSGDSYNREYRDDMIVDYEAASGTTYFDDIVSWRTAPQMWFEKVH